MAVELEVENSRSALAPGMYAGMTWPLRKPRPSLLAPPTNVVTNTKFTFVIRADSGKAEGVKVSTGVLSRDLVEVFGPLEAGDISARRAGDEIREGTPLPK
jgi:hypothetical protein